MTAPCPDVSTLEQLLLGQISGAEVERLEEHVEACPRCAETARSLRTEDMLVKAMRSSGNTEALPEQKLIDAVIPLLKRLRPREETATLPPQPNSSDLRPGEETATLPPRISPGERQGVPATEAQRGPVAEVAIDFLAPPRAPDEMGWLGPYRVLRLLGAGGMGMVFLAEDPRLKRQIGLKVIRPELVARSDLRERFLREAQAVAAVEHDNIIAIHHVDEARGVTFLAMPLLRGETLEERLRRAEGPLPLEELLRVGREIAAGLAAAHERGLVHRDIKPGNIFLVTSGAGRGAEEEQGTTGERVAPTAAPPVAHVKILDFGLARAIRGEEQDLPGAGTIQGTPGYMAPEQACGQAGDARADLFSLGCVLYRAATGQSPFRGSDLIGLLMSAATEQPSPPQQLNPALPPPLADLIVQLLAKRPEERPPSAHAVVEAIQAIEEERAEAGRPRPSRRRWLLLTVVAVLAAAGLTAWLVMPGETPPPAPGEVTFDFDEPERRLVIQREDQAEQVVDLKDSHVHSLPPGEYAVRLTVEKQGRRLWPDRFLVKEGEATAVALGLVGEVRRGDGHTQTVWAVALSPRKGSLLTLSASNDQSIGLWDAATDAGVSSLGNHDGPVRCVTFSADGRYAASGSGNQGRRRDFSVRLWDVDKRQSLASFLGHERSVTAVAFAPDGRRLLSGGDDGSAFIWDVKTQQIVLKLEGHDRRGVYGAAFAPDGRQTLTGGADNLVILWNADTGEPLKRLAGHTEAVRAVAFAPGGAAAASASWDGSVRVWDLKSGTVREVRGHKGEVHAVAYSPDGHRLLSGGRDGTVRLWDAASGQEVYCFQGHRGAVHGVAFSADGRLAVSGGADRTMRLWKLPR